MPAVSRESRFFTLETEGTSIIVESFDDTPQAGPVARRGVVENTGKTMQEAFAQLSAIIEPLRTHVKSQLEDASEIAIEFGVKLTAQANLVVAKSELEGNFKITVKWKK